MKNPAFNSGMVKFKVHSKVGTKRRARLTKKLYKDIREFYKTDFKPNEKSISNPQVAAIVRPAAPVEIKRLPPKLTKLEEQVG